MVWDNEGIKIDGKYLSDLRFVDVIVPTTDNLGNAQRILPELKKATEKVGLNINFQKTKFMTNLMASDNMQIVGEEVQQVQEYNYLGHEIRVGGKTKHVLCIAE